MKKGLCIVVLLGILIPTKANLVTIETEFFYLYEHAIADETLKKYPNVFCKKKLRILEERIKEEARRQKRAK